MNKLKTLLFSIIIGLAAATTIAFAWTSPTAAPPGGGGALYYSSNGNVGVGTTSPSSKFTVTGVIESTTGGIKFPDATTQTTAYAGGSQTITAANVSSGNFGANTGGGNYYFSGNVGIGTTGPTIKLAVGDTDTGLSWAGDGQLDLFSNNVNTMSIRSGNVGIGTTGPNYKLEVAGDINASNAVRAGGVNLRRAWQSRSCCASVCSEPNDCPSGYTSFEVFYNVAAAGCSTELVHLRTCVKEY